jgi:Icc-related predicted phosphoesterase
VALLHYAPIDETVKGERPEIYPFLGSSRLEEPLTRHPLTAVFHGHSHHGQLQGQTRTGTPVYNVAAPLLRETSPEGRAFHLLELSTTAPEA